MTNLHKILPDSRIKPATAHMSGGRASDQATAPQLKPIMHGPRGKLSYSNDPKFLDGQVLQEQSYQGLHWLPFRLHRLDFLLNGRAT